MPDPEKLLNEPPETVMSPITKFVVASFDVNVSARVASLDVSPSLTSAAVIVIVGATESFAVNVAFAADIALSEASSTVVPIAT